MSKTIAIVLSLITKKTALFSLIFIILIFGAFLRLYHLSTPPYWMDEGYTINAILSINENGSSILDSGNYYSCPTYCYPTAFITKFFGENASSFRILSAIAGIIFIIVIFYTTSNLFNTNIAALSSFFITFSYWQIAWSRQARWYTLFSLFFWLAIYFFYKSLNDHIYKKHRVICFLSTLFFSIITILTHRLGYLLPFIFFIWFIIDRIFIKKIFEWKKILSATIVLLSAIFFMETVLNANFISPIIENFHFYYVLPYYLNFYLRNYWLFIIFSVVALCSVNFYKKEIYFLTFIFISYLIPLSFLTDTIQYRYLFHLTPAFYILSSVTILDIYKHIQKRFFKIILMTSIILIFFTIGGGTLALKEFYNLESDNPNTLWYRPYYAYTPQPDWNSAYNFIKINKKERDVIISSQPQFNKIFLGEAGYWIKYNYLGTKDNPKNTVKDGREYYVNARVVDDAEELKDIVNKNSGFIIFDYMATDMRISKEIQEYIKDNMNIVFYKETNAYSRIWVYKF